MRETSTRRRSRMRVFVRAQLPFLISVAFIAVAIQLAAPEEHASGLLTLAYGVAVLASVACIVVPWRRLDSAWLLTIPLADLVAVAFVRAELVTVLPAAGMLAIFPILWLAYDFPWYGIVVAICGSAFITTFTYLYRGAWPATPMEWVNVVTLPTIILAVGVVVHIAARALRASSRRLAQAHERQSEALQAARDTQTTARTILDTVDMGIAFYDAEDTLYLFNREAGELAALAGFRLQDPPFAGPRVLAADRVTPLPFDQQIIPRALRGEILDGHMEWLGPADAQVAILASSRRVEREDGQQLGTVVVAHDVTELANAIELREQFLRTVSHELRTPLTTVLGYLDLITEAVDPREEKIHAHLALVTARTESLNERIRELLAATPADEQPNKRPVDLDDIIDAAVTATGDLASRHRVRIARVAAPSATVHVDRGQIVQAVSEVLHNAVKFGEAESAVTVSHTVTDTTASISVTNRGVGISPAEQTRLFDRFYRTPYARAQAVQGFGLGLAVAKDAVAAHGGRIRIDSAPGAETTFTIDVPVD